MRPCDQPHDTLTAAEAKAIYCLARQVPVLPPWAQPLWANPEPWPCEVTAVVRRTRALIGRRAILYGRGDLDA